ncbi:MAG: sugar transferase [Sphingomonadaceae bacterium]
MGEAPTGSRILEKVGWDRQHGFHASSTSSPSRVLYLWTKRLTDIVLSAAALLLLSPLLVAVGLLIRLDTPGPVLFAQERMGYDWRRGRLRPFTIYKFRSMHHNSDQSLHEQHVRDWIRSRRGRKGDGESVELVKLVNDPRITRVGRLLRKTSIDELPQLWNVLRGDMSLVGPRPVPLYEVAEYEDWHWQRLQATPGITCLWQVRGRGLTSLEEMVRMDIEYIERRSLWFDMRILLLTVPVVLFGRGAA